MPRRQVNADGGKHESKRQELAGKIALFAPAIGENQTLISGLSLFRRVAPSERHCGAYEPSLNVFAQGKKRVSLGGKSYLVDGSAFLLSSIDVPVESQILEASQDVPLFSMLLRLEMPVVREILNSEDLPEVAVNSKGLGIAIGETTVALFDVCSRLLDLLESPHDVPFMSRLIQREIVYRLLCSPQGERLRAIATAGDLSHRTAKAITWLKVNYAKPLRVEELADIARMGVSTLHHQFRALTAMSPLQYQKQLRLNAARDQMLNSGTDATSAAFEVGCESVSQFNREYSRLFGRPPMRDVKALRSESSNSLRLA